MLRHVHEPHAVSRIVQERLPRRHRFQHAALPLHTERVCRDAAQARDQQHQGGRTMRGQVVRHEDPTGLGIGREGLLDVRGEVDLTASLLHRGSDHFAGRDFEVADEHLRAVPLVLDLASFDPAGPHRLGRRLRFERLDARLLVDAHRVNALRFQSFRCCPIRFAHVTHLLIERDRILRIGVEPVPALVGLKCRLLKNVRPVGRKSRSRCRVGRLRRSVRAASSASPAAPTCPAVRRPPPGSADRIAQGNRVGGPGRTAGGTVRPPGG